MKDFKTVILNFAEKGSSFEDLEAEMINLLQQEPDAAEKMLEVLSDAREESMMTDQQYNHLLTQLVQTDTILLSDAHDDNEEAHETQTVEPKQFFSNAGEKAVETVGTGTVIKERFELVGVLGEGGMGMVYKAKDLIKVEAKDRQPYLAIKVLNENFKKHPESFIALQRECSRSQKLAHPNIATVYDFDRYGSMVYMTMELLEGEPLNDFIKNHVPETGLNFDKALPMIEDMAYALEYAHSRGIVHSDFKPGNAFITKDSGVQVLDFGIARAIKRPGQQDTTLFDAGKLGALTPAYASCEMLEAEDPDPRDDIYALAVVSYILLSGQHPFDRYPATLARDHEMTPKPLKKLTRSQNKALARGLAFHREECTPTARQFLEELKDPGKDSRSLLFPALVGLIILIALAFFPIQYYLQQEEQKQLVAEINSADSDSMPKLLNELESRDDVDIDTVLLATRDKFLSYYGEQINRTLMSSRGSNQFEQAEAMLMEASKRFPDSAEVKSLEERIERHKARTIDHIDDIFQQIVSTNNVHIAGKGKSISQLHQMIEEIDSQHALLNDPRLPLIYANMIDDALGTGDIQTAKTLVNESLTLYKDHVSVQELKEEVLKRVDPDYQENTDENSQQAEKRKANREEMMHQAKLESLKTSLIIKALAGKPDKAKHLLEELIAANGENDPFVMTQGRDQVALAYLRLANTLSEQGQYERAVQIIKSGLTVSPNNTELTIALDKLEQASGL